MKWEVTGLAGLWLARLSRGLDSARQLEDGGRVARWLQARGSGAGVLSRACAEGEKEAKTLPAHSKPSRGLMCTGLLLFSRTRVRLRPAAPRRAGNAGLARLPLHGRWRGLSRLTASGVHLIAPLIAPGTPSPDPNYGQLTNPLRQLPATEHARNNLAHARSPVVWVNHPPLHMPAIAAL